MMCSMLRGTMRRLGLTFAAVTMAAVALTAGTASAASTWVIRGAGWGHGVGMSAYGAYGYGKHGASYRKILDHYFRHLQITKLRHEPDVRVLLEKASGD